MTEKESKSFQIKTIILAAAVAGLINLAFVSFDYSRSDKKEFNDQLDKKLNIVDYNKDKVLLDNRITNNEDKWDVLIKISTENQTDIKWLREAIERRNK